MSRSQNYGLFQLIFVVSLGAWLTGCATATVATADIGVLDPQLPIIPLATPFPIRTIETLDKKTNKRIETDVLAMKSSEIRKRLTTYESFTTIQKRDTSGGLTYIGNSAKIGKGTYIITFDYVNSTVQEISFNGRAKPALGQIGVGLRITAEVTTLTNDVEIGGLIPLGIAFNDRKVNGNLRFKAFGLSNDKVASLIPVDKQVLDISGIQKAFEAAATVRLLIGLDETTLEPHLIGVTGVSVSESQNALDAAKSKLSKSP
ncbi:hypothetical protein [Pseudomonas shahriarae]|jgi:hypothetical protein|uniref:Lipoprotein n=1 Tax=Pseudomonas shahriarae TaxID=2745512 RepID=A0ABT5NDI5_9PSED|nr:hypothetical protein [Pseudomonas shahriarae]MDD0986615.1 hypothetical protein [Pseudomonas shahriarae]MDD1034058.1 hypothetical protein [Pseudomonas shahriarae]